MKIIIARCASNGDNRSDALSVALIDQLRSADHKTELIVIPPIGDGFNALMAVASHRLMNLRNICDALICLDGVASVIQHDRKYAIVDDHGAGVENTPVTAEARFLAKLIEAGMAEAKKVNVPVQGNPRQSSSEPIDVSPLLKELE